MSDHNQRRTSCPRCGGDGVDDAGCPDDVVDGTYDPACCRFPKMCSQGCTLCRGSGKQPLEASDE